LKSEYEKQISELKKQLPVNEVKALPEAQITPLKEEIEGYKAKEAGEKRNAFILAKAKELGIPQSRIDEGFAIAPEADKAKIGDYLAKVAKNAVAKVVAGGTTTVPRVVKDAVAGVETSINYRMPNENKGIAPVMWTEPNIATVEDCAVRYRRLSGRRSGCLTGCRVCYRTHTIIFKQI
jgi:hypothetical protein